MSSKTSKYSTSSSISKSCNDLSVVQSKTDALIPYYNTHNDNSVMEGIKKIKNKWQINYQGFKLIRPDKETAVSELKNYLVAKHGMIENIKILAAEDYDKNKIIVYNHNDKLLFDLYHISHFMSISSKKLTNKFKEGAIKYLVKNKYGGYELKVLVDDTVVNSLSSLKKSKTNTALIAFINELIVKYSQEGQKNNTEDIITDEGTEEGTYEDSVIDDESNVSRSTNEEIIENYVMLVNETNQDKLLMEEKLEEAKIKQYSKYTDKNPMKYVSECIIKKAPRWKFRVITDNDTKVISKTFAIGDKDKAINTALDYFNKEYENSIVERNFVFLAKMVYNGKFVFLYNYKNDIHVDLNLALENLSFKNPKDKYTEYKKHVSFYLLKQNDHGGYIIKPMISEKTYYKLVLNSETPFAKKFKDDIAELISQVRKNGNLQLTNQGFEYKPSTSSNNLLPSNQEIIVQNLSKDIEARNIDRLEMTKQCMHSDTFINKLLSYVKNADNINLVNYLRTSVMYMFCVITKPTSKRRGLDTKYIYFKIGWSHDFATRWTDLIKEYGANFYLMSIVTVEKERIEQDFHKNLKQIYPHLMTNITINNTRKEEVYFADECIINLFEQIKEYKDFTNVTEDKLSEDNQIIKQQKEQYRAFIDDINYIRSILCVVESTNLNDLQLNLLLNFNNHQHDINLAKLENDKLALENDKIILQKELEIIKQNSFKSREQYEINVAEAKKKCEIELNESKRRHEAQLNESKKQHEIELIKIKYDKKMEYSRLMSELKFQKPNDGDFDASFCDSNY